MYQIAYIGRWETLPETAAAICDHDISKLEAMLQGGLELNAPIHLSEYIKLTPLEIAVFRNDVDMIHFLLEHGADPNLAEEQPLLLRLSVVVDLRWWLYLLSRFHNSIINRKSELFRKFVGATAQRIYMFWNKQELQ